MSDENKKPSEFYLACRNGDLTTVEHLLPTLQDSDLCRLEPNGSTGLHAAAFYGHIQIVRCILERDNESCSLRTIRNIPFDLTPVDEARNDCIRQLFGSDCIRTGRTRFATNDAGQEMFFSPASLSVNNATDAPYNKGRWFDEYANAHRIAQENHEYMRQWLIKVPLENLLLRVNNDYVEKMTELGESKQYINRIFQTAIDDGDPRYLLFAYTTATPFFGQLNKDLAQKGSDFRFGTSLATADYHMDNVPPFGVGQFLYTAIIVNEPSLSTYYYAGTCYRGMNLSVYELNQYVPGARILTRSFLSGSKNPYVPGVFLSFDEPNIRPVLFVYRITRRHTAIAAYQFSAFPQEEEILIIPFVAFSVEFVSNDSFEYEDRGRATQIFLQEVEPNHQGTIPDFEIETLSKLNWSMMVDINRIKDDLDFIIRWGYRNPACSDQFRRMCTILIDLRRVLEVQFLGESSFFLQELLQLTKRVKDFLYVGTDRIDQCTIADVSQKITRLLAHMTEIRSSQQIDEQPSNINIRLREEIFDLSALSDFSIYFHQCIMDHSHIHIGGWHAVRGNATNNEHDVSTNLIIRIHTPLIQFLADRTFAFERADARRLLDSTISDRLDEHEVYRHVIASRAHEITKEQSTKTMNAGAILREHSCIVILGDPGCGKTTFLRWLTHLSAELWLKNGNHDESQLSSDPDRFVLDPLRIPVLVRVGEVALQIASNPNQSLLDCICRPTWFGKVIDETNEQMTSTLIRYAIEQGRALIMFDGLDEISDPQKRRVIVSLIFKFINRYVFVDKPISSQNQLIVTSRIVGYYVEPLLDDRIAHYIVAPLAVDSINEFIGHWFASLTPPIADQYEQVSTLKNLLSTSNILQNLASNLLLLSVICTLAVVSCTSSQSIVDVYKNRVNLYDALVQSMLHVWQLRDPTMNIKHIKELLSSIAVHMQRYSRTGLIEEFDVEAICRRFQSQSNSVLVVPSHFVRIISDGIGIFVPRGLCIYGFLHKAFEEYFAALYLVQCNDKMSVFIVVQRLIYLSTDPRFREPLLLALGWISSNWSLENFDLVCQSLLNEDHNLHLPISALMIMSAIPDLSQLPSTSILFTAFDQFLCMTAENNWLIHFPFFAHQLTLALAYVPSHIASDWIQHVFQTSEPVAVRELSRTLLEKFHKENAITPPWLDERLCAVLQKVVPIEFKRNNYFASMLLLLISHRVPYILPMPSGSLREFLLQNNIIYIEPCLLSIIISLYGGLHRVVDTETGRVHVTFSAWHMQHDSSLSSILCQLFHDYRDEQVKLGKCLLDYCISLINEINEEEESFAVVDAFIVWMCFQGATYICLHNQFIGYKAFQLARTRFIHNALDLREVFYVQYEETPCTAKDQASFLIDRIVLSSGIDEALFSFIESTAYALSRLTCAIGSLYVQCTTTSERLLNLPLPPSVTNREIVSQYLTNCSTTAVLIYIRTICSPLRRWLGYDLCRETDKDELEQVKTGKHMMLFWGSHSSSYRLAIAISFFPRYHQTVWMRLIDASLSNESEQYKAIPIMLVELLLCNLVEPASNSLRYAILLLILRPELDKYHLDNCVRAVLNARVNIKVNDIYDDLLNGNQQNDKEMDNTNQNIEDDIDFDEEETDDDQDHYDLLLQKYITEERQRLQILLSSSSAMKEPEKSIKLYTCCATFMALHSSSDSKSTSKQELIEEILEAIKHIYNASLHIHALILVSTLFSASMSRDKNAHLRSQIVEYMTSEELNLEFYVVFLLQIFSLDYGVASWTDTLIRRLFNDLYNTHDENQQSAICEALLSFGRRIPSIRQRIINFIRQTSLISSSTISKTLDISSTIFRYYFYLADTIDTSTLLSCMYLIEMNVDIDEIMQDMDTNDMKERNDVALCIAALEKCPPNPCEYMSFFASLILQDGIIFQSKGSSLINSFYLT